MFNSLKTRVIAMTSLMVILAIIILSILYTKTSTDQMKESLEVDAAKNIDFTKNYIQSQYNNITAFQDALIDLKNDELKDNMAIVFASLNIIYKEYTMGVITEEEAKAYMVEELSSIKILEDDSFFWIQDNSVPAQMIMYGEDRTLDNEVMDKTIYNSLKDTNQNIFEKASETANQEGQGYMEYFWYTGEELRNHVAYVKKYDHFDWVIAISYHKDSLLEEVSPLIDNAIEELNKINLSSISQDGYFFIFNSNSDMLVHPSLAGVNVAHVLNPLTKKSLTEELMGVADFTDQSLEYLWDKPSDQGNYIHQKVAYVTYFEPLDWYIASSFYTDEATNKVNAMILNISTVAVFLTIISGLMAYMIGRGLTEPLDTLIGQIEDIDYNEMPDNINVEGTSEINTLVKVMNKMILSIKGSQKEIEETHYQIQTIFDSMYKMAVISTDVNGLIETFNVGAENLLGYSADEMIGQFTPSIFHDKEEVIKRSAELSLQYEKAIDGFDTFVYIPKIQGYEEREWTYITKSGQKISVNLIVTKMTDTEGHLTGFLGLANDVSMRKDTEEQLKKRTEELKAAVKNLIVHEEHLEDMVRERTIKLEESVRTIQETQNQLIESEKMALLGSLVAGVAHEINTPVGIGVTLASSLEDRTRKIQVLLDDRKLTKGHIVDYIEMVMEVSKMLSRTMTQAGDLIQSFKLVAVDQSVESKRHFNLSEYVEEILNSLGSKFKRSNVDVKIQSDALIELNSYPGTFYQIFTNLLMNSLNHGFEELEGGSIIIKLQEIDDQVEIIYSDDGVGISELEVKKIFEPFYTTKRHKGGTGLGLNIVNNLVFQKLKGSISCESSPGKGITYKIVFPKENA